MPIVPTSNLLPEQHKIAMGAFESCKNRHRFDGDWTRGRLVILGFFGPRSRLTWSRTAYDGDVVIG